MSYFRQLWQPPIEPGTFDLARTQVEQAARAGSADEKERGFIRALTMIFGDASVPYHERVSQYEQAAHDLAAADQSDGEAQVFYALALLANASPADKTHEKQKRAVDLLEPPFRRYPEHPGIAHYLIHACDNTELAARGLPAARLYSQIAPSAPHALHMPSHIFTRLGLWEDSIGSNRAARDAAHAAGDLGEELHAMDYLVYAYLQTGAHAEAGKLVEQVKAIRVPENADFKVTYAATAMPIRYIVERRRWSDASTIVPPTNAPPHVIALAVWAKGVGLSRSGHAGQAATPVSELQRIEGSLRTDGDTYWSTQVRVMKREVQAWIAQAQGRNEEAASLMRQAADEEDSVEKLPVTPGPIIPAREQLGTLLLEQHHPDLAAGEFRAALANAPGRRGAVEGTASAEALLRNP